MVGGWVGGFFRRSKSAPHRCYQLQLGLPKQKAQGQTSNTVKPPFTRHAGQAGGFTVDLSVLFQFWNKCRQVHHVFSWEIWGLASPVIVAKELGPLKFTCLLWSCGTVPCFVMAWWHCFWINHASCNHFSLHGQNWNWKWSGFVSFWGGVWSCLEK